MEKEPRDEIPFREPIKIIDRSGTYVNVGELPSNDKVVIKEFRHGEVAVSWPGRKLEIRESAFMLQDYFKRLKQDFPQEFAQFFPKTQLVIGKNRDGEEALFIVQEKIIGETLESHSRRTGFLSNNEEQDNQIKKIIRMLVKFYLKTFDPKISAGQTLEVFNGRNCIFGRKASEPDAKESIFMVDTTPLHFSRPYSVADNIKYAIERLGFDREEFADLLGQLEVLQENN
jgi:hypothetical protein